MPNNADRTKPEKATGAGSEASEGIHSAGGDRNPADNSSVDGKETGRGASKDAQPTGSGEDRSGSEPLVDRETEHRSGYGGEGGKPVKSSDQR